MNYLIIGIIVLSIAIFILGSFLLYYQAVTVNTMHKDFEKMRRDLRRELGWDSYDWSSSFRDLKRVTKSNAEKLKEIESLPIIKKAKEIKRIEELERKKNDAEKELAELTGNGG
ncbi:hypothetical protein ACR3IL_00560 [Streptococcus iniae]|nr:hypothetical protein BKX95_01055 [Streptococcus iniae]QBX16819.1 hypothetical protein Javan275_0028 [Streptococcus phage Javan275]